MQGYAVRFANPVYFNCEIDPLGVSIGVRSTEHMPRSNKAESEVGYKRPPVASRFKKGQSGNPHGRRRRAPARMAAILAEELQSTAVISENGRQRKVSKMQVLIKQAVKQAMGGNFHPLVVVITKFSQNLEQLTSTATGKDSATDPIEEDELGQLSDDELREKLQERYGEVN